MRKSISKLLKKMKTPEQVQVVIVGAGAAGLAAGCRLLEKGFTDFIVVEASDRIGGRVNSIPFGRGTLDLGAEWVHGEDGNAVYKMASQYDLLYRSESPFETSTIYRSDGKPYNRDMAAELLVILDDIVDNRPNEIKAYNGSLGDFFVERFWPRINPLIEAGKLTRSDAEDCLKWLEHVENSIDGSPSWFHTAANEAIEYVKCPGNVLTTWKLGGYGTVLDLLVRRIPNPSLQLKIEEKIRFGKEVTKVDWSGETVKVSCADGSELSADRVITTVSLNVLKATAHQVFHPALPYTHLNAIQGLGMGTVDKIFLEFPYRWWAAGTGGVSLVWRAQDVAVVPKDLQWTTGVLGFYGEDNHPLSVMCGWIVGAHAEAMEAASDEEVMRECMALLRRFAGPTVEVPEALAMRRSQWFTNPYVRGSYSCRMVDSNTMDVWPRHLAQPVYNSWGKPALFFAGEATHEHYFSTVHGAIETGWREADRILSSRPREKDCSVMIVGAGVAGLAAAKTLTDAGVSVLVLEAQAVPGGRIRSLKTDKGWLELGAQWLHGENSELHRLAAARGLLSHICSVEGQGRYCRLDGTTVPAQMVQQVDDVVNRILELCEKFVSSSSAHPPSVGAELDRIYAQYLRDYPGLETSKILKDLYEWHKRFQVIDNSCDDLSKLSAKSWGLYQDCGPTHCINFKAGFSSLIDTLMSDLPEGTVLLSTPVRKIEWAGGVSGSARRRVKVFCDNLQVFTDHVIVTCSLGYLKENKDTLFSPALPQPLSKAIELLGFGTISKLYLVYEEPWWLPGEQGFQLVWAESDELLAAVPWAAGVTGFDVLRSQPVLLGWVGGPSATVVETTSEAKLKEQATLLLRRFTGKHSIPEPQLIYRSDWNSNQFVRGSYSHVTSVCDKEGINCGTLAKPVYTRTRSGSPEKVPTILLAGEACHLSHYSTVHGAYESGQEQAEVIIKHIGKITAAKL